MIRLLLFSSIFNLLAGMCHFAFAEEINHVETIRNLRYPDAKAGAELYRLHCASCHGAEGKLAINPLARRFAVDEFRFGGDPYSIWKTISYGNGLMFRWDAVLSAKERYQLTHFITELIIRKYNPEELVELDEEYFAGLPDRAAADAKAQEVNKQKVQVAVGMVDGSAGKNMDYGPFMQHSVSFGEIKDKNAEYFVDTTEKAMIIDLPGDLVFCYDATLMSVSGIWKGKIANTEKTHYTSYKGSRPMTPGGEVLYRNIDAPCWAVDSPENNQTRNIKVHGHYLHGGRVVLKYRVGDREVLETPGATERGEIRYRSFEVGPGEQTLYLLHDEGGEPPFHPSLVQESGEAEIHFHNRQQWIRIPPSSQSQSLAVTIATTNNAVAAGAVPVPDFEKMITGGPRRWPTEVQTVVGQGVNNHGYALDLLTVPLANPWGSWMRTTAMDFFEDGSLAVSTLSGDVWIVKTEAANPNALTWSRFASGMYEPLGLRIVNDEIYVRGRDRITRLHDLNNDGEADYYESFYEDPAQIGPSYHASVYDLVTDGNGYFYFSQSGYKSPLEGAVVKVSSDGKYARFVGTDLRNPNGLGYIPSIGWVTITDNPIGRAVFNGFTIAKEGVHYGYEKNRTQPMLVVLPAVVDSSSGGQCESNQDWGPLGGSIIHTSYSRKNAFYCFVQDLKPFPNGFAVKFPFELKSGLMRPRVHPIDGEVYIVAQKGWDTSGQVDGVIYRIRKTGEPTNLLVNAGATSTGIRLTFGAELDADSVNPDAFSAERIPDKKKKEGENYTVELGKVELLDSQTIHVGIVDIEKETLENRTNEDGSYHVKPAISLTFDLKTKDGMPIRQTLHATINSLPK